MITANNITKPSLEEAIEHYGVKGMKWGVRRDQAVLDRAAGRNAIPLKREAVTVNRMNNARRNQQARSKKQMSKKKKVAIAAVVVIGGVAAASILKNKGAQKAIYDNYNKESNRALNSQKDRVLYMESKSAERGLDFLNSPQAKADLWQIEENWSRGFYDQNSKKSGRK